MGVCVCVCARRHTITAMKFRYYTTNYTTNYAACYRCRCHAQPRSGLWRWKFSSFFYVSVVFLAPRSSYSTSTFVFYNSDATKMLMRNRKQADCRISIRTFFSITPATNLLSKLNEKNDYVDSSRHTTISEFRVHIYFLRHHFSRPTNLDY